METIGIIEDDELLGQALAIALRKEGYETLSAVNCREGRGLLEKNPDLLLIDINLPDGDGISFWRAAFRTSFLNREAITGTVTIDDWCAFDGTVAFDGSRKFNAQHTQEEL